MKTKGVINEFNGRYGTINMNNEIVDFSAKDISNNEKVNDEMNLRLPEHTKAPTLPSLVVREPCFMLRCLL